MEGLMAGGDRVVLGGRESALVTLSLRGNHPTKILNKQQATAYSFPAASSTCRACSPSAMNSNTQAPAHSSNVSAAVTVALRSNCFRFCCCWGGCTASTAKRFSSTSSCSLYLLPCCCVLWLMMADAETWQRRSAFVQLALDARLSACQRPKILLIVRRAGSN